MEDLDPLRLAFRLHPRPTLEVKKASVLALASAPAFGGGGGGALPVLGDTPAKAQHTKPEHVP